MRNFTRVSAGVLVALSLATAAQAQSANITATAVVQQPITVTGAANLDFGNVFPGVAKTVAVTDATAGRFNVTGQASAPGKLSFTLPTNLVNGGNNLAIGTWSGNVNTTASPTGTSFTPSAAVQAFTFSGTGTAFVYVGATVTPTVAQVAGTYTGTVTMTVTY
jgi:hypothetical protein